MSDTWDVEVHLQAGNSYAEVRGENAFEYYIENVFEPALDGSLETEDTISLTPSEKYDEDDLDELSRLLSTGGDLFIYRSDEEYALQINLKDDLKAQIHRKKD